MSELKSEHKTILKGTFWGILGSVALKLVSFIYTIFLARFFLPEDIGTFYLSLSVMYLIAFFGDLGMGTSIGRYVPYFIGKGEKHKVYSLLQISYVYVGILSAVLSVALFLAAGTIAAYFKNQDLETAVQYISLFLFLNSIFGIATSFLGGLKQFKAQQFVLNLQNVLKLVLAVIMFLIFGASQHVISASFVFSYAIAAILLIFLVKRSCRELNLQNTKLTFEDQVSILKEVVPFGLTVSLITSFWVLAIYVDRILLGHYLDQTAALNISIYTMAISLATLVTVFAGTLTGIFSPVASGLFGKGDSKQMKEVSVSSMRWSIFLSAPLAVLLIVFPGEILSMFYGSTYAAGASVLAIFSFAIFIRNLSSVQATILASQRILRVELYAAVISFIVNLVLCILLIPSYGIEGAAIASLISLTLVTLLIDYYSKKLAGFGFSRDVLKPLLAAVLSFTVLFFFKGYLIALLYSVPQFSLDNGIIQLLLQKGYKLLVLGVLLVLSCISYLFFIMLFKGVHDEDRELARTALKRVQITLGFYRDPI